MTTRGRRRLFGVMCVMGMVAALLVASAGPSPAAKAGDRVGLHDGATAMWYLEGVAPFMYGNPGDQPMMGDWDCDGTDTPGLYRRVSTSEGPAGKVYLRNTNTTGIAHVEYFYGDPNDIAVAGDFNGDGCDTVSLFRPSTGQVFLTNLLGSANRGIGAAQVTYRFPSGGADISGARVVAGDFDGNGIDSVALHLPSTGAVLGVRSGAITFGNPGDQLIAGAWGGGADALGVYRPSADLFHLAGATRDLSRVSARSSSGGGTAVAWSDGPGTQSSHPPVTCGGLTATIVGTANADVLNGGNGDDVIAGLGGNDVIGGKNGNDTVCGGDGADVIDGDQGNDTLFGDAGDDNLNGKDGNDTIHGGSGNDIISGDKDDDTLFGGDGADNMNGDAGNDFMDGEAGDDLMNGGTGDDTLLGRSGGNVINGGPQFDTCDVGPDGLTKTKCENDRPQAANQTVNVLEDGPPVTTAFATTDPNGDPTTYTITSGPAKGTVSVNQATGQFTFDPAGQFESLAADQQAVVTFTYIATDSHGAASDTATVTVTVTGVDDPFVAADDNATTDEDTAVVIAVLANDDDPDADDTPVLVGPVAVGASFQTSVGAKVTRNANGTFTYDPRGVFDALAKDVETTDSFDYTAGSTNAASGQDDAKVTVTIKGLNDAPTANSQAVSTSGTTPITITLTGGDVDGDDITFQVVSGPTHGTLSTITPVPPPPPPPGDPGRTPGTGQQTAATVVYTPFSAADLNDEFSFVAVDTHSAQSAPAFVTINNATGDQGSPGQPPTTVTAQDVTRETTTGVPVDVPLSANAPDGVTVSFAITSLPASGGLSEGGTAIETVPYVLSGNVVTYTPPAGTELTATFTFEASGEVDNVLVTSSATATVIVGDPPELAEDVQVTTPLNTPVAFTLVGNAGGSGTPPGPQSVGRQTQHEQQFGAAIAGNVSDATGDGQGDGRDNLPGPAPVLVAAGVDVNLGALPSGSVTDPAGDATNDTRDDPANPDLVSATVGSDGGNLNLSVRFVQSGFSSATSRGSFVLDTDENPATGFPGVDAANNDSALMGVEFLVNIGANLGANAQVLKFVSPPNNFTTVGTFPATVLSDGYDVSIPLSAFDNDDGRLTFKAETQSYLGPGFTGILDYAPNLGLAPGQSKAGVSGTARVQIEFDISNVTDASSIDRATITLHTQKGTVDSLDTIFFVGTGEADGTLAVSDYQAPMRLLPGVVMPATTAPTGTEGTFTFDVTDELREAVSAGRSFLSIQARVDESLAGQGFNRGLQIRSTADGNLTSGKQPKLDVSFVQPGPQLTYTVTALPLASTGTVTFNGAQVTVGQTFATAPTMLYTPAVGFTGNTQMSYTVAQGNLIDGALVDFTVLGDDCAPAGRPPGCSPPG